MSRTVLRLIICGAWLVAGCNGDSGLGSGGGGGDGDGGGSGSGGSDDSGSGGGGGDAGTGSGGELGKFSFFVTSLKAMQQLSGNPSGFGGDLSFGESGAGKGLRGADKICTTIAEMSMPGSSKKVWHAFLSVTADANGEQVDAIDRIGDGPWYDRTGRLLSMNKADLLNNKRPTTGDATIKNDFPNEDGVPNHAPDPGAGQVDNHDILTGTGANGKLYSAKATCLDWTVKAGNTSTEGKPRVGHSWPRGGGGGGMGPGGISGEDWKSALDEAGCAPGVNLIEMGPPNPANPTVGSGGGYGGIYCFALTP